MDKDVFKNAMALFPAGVTLTTAFDQDGQPNGLTLMAFSSLSLDPPLVLVCLGHSSNTLAALRSTQAFSVNILGAGSEGLAMLFASKDPDKFAGLEWQKPSVGVGGPLLPDVTAAWIACGVHQIVDVGDHAIVVGEPREVGIAEDPDVLLYSRREFATWSTLTQDEGEST